jgi:hypothetical protein
MSQFRGREATDDVAGIMEDAKFVLNLACQEKFNWQLIIRERLK